MTTRRVWLHDPRSPAFLDLRFKRIRYALWRVKRGRSIRRWDHVTYARSLHTAALIKRIEECPHENRRDNPEATAVIEYDPQVCLDCGVGLLSKPWRRP